MRLLLDTHVLLWWMMDDPALSPQARKHVADRANAVHVSAASIWEIAIKLARGKLKLPADFGDILDHEPFTRLDIGSRHAWATASLPPLHGDPFDRMLVAQCRVEHLTLLTRDRFLRDYGITIVEA